MTASLTQQETGISTTTATTHTYTLTKAYSIGTVLVVGDALAGQVATGMTISDSKSNTWSAAVAAQTAVSTFATVVGWVSTLTTALAIGDTITITSTSASTMDIVLATGTGVTSTILVSSTGAGNSAGPYTVTGVTTTAGNLVVAMASSAYASLATDWALTGGTNLAGSNQSTARSIALGYKTSTATTETASATVVNSHPWCQIMFELQAAATTANHALIGGTYVNTERLIWNGSTWS